MTVSIPMATPDPLSVWPVSSFSSPRPALATVVPRKGSRAFGASRAGGRRTIGVTLAWPEIQLLLAPLPGKVLSILPWEPGVDEPICAAILRTDRYFFNLGGMRRAPITASKLAVGQMIGEPAAPARGYFPTLHFGMFERVDGMSDSDFVALMRRGDLIWRSATKPPALLRDPTEFLIDASARVLEAPR